MPSHSSTSSFSQRLRGSAFPRVVLGILLVELVAHRSLVDGFASHEVDVLLRDIPRAGGDARVVLMGDSVGFHTVGTPLVKGAKVTAKVESHGRGPKIKIIKFRRRKQHRKQMGHRQAYTELSITDISAK